MASYRKMGCCGTGSAALGQLDEGTATAATAPSPTEPDWTKLFFTSTLAGLAVYFITRTLSKKE